MKFFRPIFIAVLLAAPPVMAQTPSFDMPVDCQLGENCWIVNYVDSEPGNDAKDFTCGPRTYNDHHGTDFGLADLLSAEKGVDVLAAANGKVLRIRDGVNDRIATEKERQKLLAENRGCGNGVFIDHGNGWQTIYCHLKKNSIMVKPDQHVKTSDKIGKIGYSGIAEFPHLHFGVFFENQPVDPFAGLDNRSCEEQEQPLWDENLNLEYDPVTIYATGFKAGVPDFDAIKVDSASAGKISSRSEALVFWAAFYGVRKGDKVRMEISDPMGRVFANRDIEQPKTRAQQLYYVGRRTSENKLEEGTYTGNVRLIRKEDGGSVIERQEDLRVTID